MLLTYILSQEWLEPEQIPRAVDALVEAAAKPDDHPLLARAWAHLAPMVRAHHALFRAFASAPPPVLREVAAALASAAATDLRLFAAAIEIGNGPVLLQVKSALDRLSCVKFSTYEGEREKLRGLAPDGRLVRCADRALRRLRAHAFDVMVDGLALQIFALLVLTGGESAGQALGCALRAFDSESVDSHLRPRLALASDEPHVVEALAWLTRDESPAALTFAPAPLSMDELRALECAPYVPATRDENLSRAILDAAVEAGRVELPTFELIDPYEVDEQVAEAARTAVRNALLAVPIPDDFVRKLRMLHWPFVATRAAAVVRLLDPDWDGESHSFDVRHLFHAGDLASLEEMRLELAAEEPAPTLSPLRKLPSLVRLTWWVKVASLTPLLELTKLKEVTIRYDETEENAAVVEILAERGVMLTAW
jgi:hypothetical protein